MAERPMMTADPARTSWDEFVALAEGDRRELLDGVLVETEVPGRDHEFVVVRLSRHLDIWAEQNGCRVLGSGYKLRVSEHRGVMPDIQVLSEATWRTAGDAALEAGRPEHVVEVLSPTSARYDRAVKREYYGAIGVPEYWLVDPAAKLLERFVLGADGYVAAEAVCDDAVFEPATLAGLRIELGGLWPA